MVQIARVSPADLRHVGAYAEMIRTANLEDFGELAQIRSDEEFANEIRAADGKLAWFTLTISPDDPEVIGGLEIVDLGEDRAQISIRVLKALQGYGFGQEALAFAKDVCRSQGMHTIFGAAAARSRRDNRNVRFLLKSGFEEIMMLLRQDVRLDVDPSRWDVPQPEGVTIGVASADFDVALTTAIVGMNKLFAQEEPALAPPTLMTTDGEGLAALYQRMEAGGRHIVIGYAQAPDGEYVAYCEAQVAPGDRIAEQYLSYVKPAFRRRGVVKAVKAAMLTEIKRLSDSAEYVRVFLPAELTSLAQVNRDLGYVDTAYYREWKLAIG